MFNFTGYNFDGEESLIGKDSQNVYLAILGSRSILDYTKELLESLFEELSRYKNLVIVSGGMYGVDLLAHNLSLKYSLGTIVFLPCGIDTYKKSFLYKSLKVNSTSKILLVSKYPYNNNSRRYTYLERNRGIIDFSKVVLIAQSGLKSGSIYSGNYSLKVRKPTFCVPISLNHQQFLGNNILISKGAKIFIDCRTLLNELEIQENILDISLLIKFLPRNFEELVENFREYDPDEIEKTLLEGILRGDLIFENGRFFNNDK